MSPSLTKVIYKDPHSTDEFIIFVNPNECKKWKDGDKTISLAAIVDAFLIFHSGQGCQGILRQPSQQQLDTVFGTHKDVDVVEFILTNGKVQHGDGIASSGTTNISRGSNNAADNRRGLSGI